MRGIVSEQGLQKMNTYLLQGSKSSAWFFDPAEY
jgi:hypothetical protein